MSQIVAWICFSMGKVPNNFNYNIFESYWLVTSGFLNRWVFHFAHLRQLPVLVPYMPTENPRLRDTAYEVCNMDNFLFFLIWRRNSNSVRHQLKGIFPQVNFLTLLGNELGTFEKLFLFINHLLSFNRKNISIKNTRMIKYKCNTNKRKLTDKPWESVDSLCIPSDWPWESSHELLVWLQVALVALATNPAFHKDLLLTVKSWPPVIYSSLPVISAIEPQLNTSPMTDMLKEVRFNIYVF